MAADKKFFLKREAQRSLKAVFFDMDGVIIDSMPYHFLAWYESLRSCGVRVSCMDVYTREGENWEKSLCDLLGRERIRCNKKILEQIFLRRREVFERVFRPVLFDGAFDLLRALKNKGLALGLVTGTSKKDMERMLPYGIRVLFDCLVTGDMLKHGKPHPEPYLTAMDKLGLSARECLVVENAPLGIKAAKDAGVCCLAVSTSLPDVYLKRADAVLKDLFQVSDFLGVRIKKSSRGKIKC